MVIHLIKIEIIVEDLNSEIMSEFVDFLLLMRLLNYKRVMMHLDNF